MTILLQAMDIGSKKDLQGSNPVCLSAVLGYLLSISAILMCNVLHKVLIYTACYLNFTILLYVCTENNSGAEETLCGCGRAAGASPRSCCCCCCCMQHCTEQPGRCCQPHQPPPSPPSSSRIWYGKQASSHKPTR